MYLTVSDRLTLQLRARSLALISRPANRTQDTLSHQEVFDWPLHNYWIGLLSNSEKGLLTNRCWCSCYEYWNAKNYWIHSYEMPKIIEFITMNYEFNSWNGTCIYMDVNFSIVVRSISYLYLKDDVGRDSRVKDGWGVWE